jgi:hypothetical protein
MRDFIESLRAKPDQTRKQIALFTASGLTGLVAIMWVVAFTSSGALSRTTPKEEGGIKAAFSEQNGASLLGAIGALTTREDGSIEVVGTSASSTAPAPSTDERTVIPF